MENIIFTESWQPIFAEARFHCLDDFFNYDYGENVNKNNKRQVIKFTLETAAGQKTLFMKRFYKPHFKDIIAAKLSFGKFYSQARIEWENANLLLKNGVGTYKPVCYGEKMKLGLERKSFFITEELKGPCFTDFVRENWQSIDQQKKNEIISGIAQTIRKVHDAAISLTDLYVWHIFVNQSSDGNYTFDIIDLHRMSHNVTDKNKQLKNLGRFDHSMTNKYFDDEIRRVFVESYAGDNWPGNIEKLITQVKRYSDKVSTKRNPKPY